ncbi:hypothetical protein SAMN05877809_10560 [Rhodobacter sp. JA431]|uniref:hypothetical protein n=1 Tax=Rhodobacter sp. JA431 TaxID=570013 RepID=UPI000BD5BF90|nr:hypothetical protein [Rhodobacter sp. JA431]SOC10061.1 hypothetical protein SAMN05877809_10560 [Rhodobacter sp. JA431]
METKILPTKKLGTAELMFGLTIFVLGLLLALNIIALRGASRSDAEIMTVIGLVFMAISMPPLLLGLRQKLRPAGMLLSATGFHDRQVTKREVPWSALKEIRFDTHAKMGRIVFLKVDHPAFSQAGIRISAWLAAYNKDKGLGYSGRSVEGTVDDFAHELHAYASQALGQTR